MAGFSLTRRQRRMLSRQLKNSRSPETVRRIFALLAIDQGESVDRTARILTVGRRTVYDWIARYRARKTPEALVRQAGQGRPRILDGAGRGFMQSVLQKSPQELGYPAAHWTIPLLQDYLRKSRRIGLSPHTIRRELHRRGYVWKGYRYVRRRIPEMGRKNPGFAKSRG
jgi:transposase